MGLTNGLLTLRRTRLQRSYHGKPDGSAVDDWAVGGIHQHLHADPDERHGIEETYMIDEWVALIPGWRAVKTDREYPQDDLIRIEQWALTDGCTYDLIKGVTMNGDGKSATLTTRMGRSYNVMPVTYMNLELTVSPWHQYPYEDNAPVARLPMPSRHGDDLWPMNYFAGWCFASSKDPCPMHVWIPDFYQTGKARRNADTSEEADAILLAGKPVYAQVEWVGSGPHDIERGYQFVIVLPNGDIDVYPIVADSAYAKSIAKSVNWLTGKKPSGKARAGKKG